jgi:hypothetical protein
MQIFNNICYIRDIVLSIDSFSHIVSLNKYKTKQNPNWHLSLSLSIISNIYTDSLWVTYKQMNWLQIYPMVYEFVWRLILSFFLQNYRIEQMVFVRKKRFQFGVIHNILFWQNIKIFPKAWDINEKGLNDG